MAFDPHADRDDGAPAQQQRGPPVTQDADIIASVTGFQPIFIFGPP